MHNAKIIIKRLKEAVGVERDYELADKLGIEPGTVSGWKKRSGGVPLEYIQTVCKDYGVTFESITDGGQKGGAMPDGALLEMFLQVSSKLEKIDTKLDQCSAKLAELQEEVEKLKKGVGGSIIKKKAS